MSQHREGYESAKILYAKRRVNMAGMARVGFLGYGFLGFLWVNPIFINSRIWVFWVFLFFS